MININVPVAVASKDAIPDAVLLLLLLLVLESLLGKM